MPAAPHHTTDPIRNPLTLCAADLMVRDLVTVRASDCLADLERTLVDAQVGGVPVLDDEGDLLGIVSMRDLLRHRTEQDRVPSDLDPSFTDPDEDADEDERQPPPRFVRRPDTTCAADIMAADILSVRPDTHLIEIARTMVTEAVHRLLVVDRGRLVGIVTTMDVLAGIAAPRRVANG